MQLFQPAIVFRKKTPAQMFSWWFCKMFKSNYFLENLQTAASVVAKNEIQNLKSHPSINRLKILK